MILDKICTLTFDWDLQSYITWELISILKQIWKCVNVEENTKDKIFHPLIGIKVLVGKNPTPGDHESVGKNTIAPYIIPGHITS